MTYQKGHPFYGDLSKPNYFKRGHIPWNKGKEGYQIASYVHWLNKPNSKHPKSNQGKHIWEGKIHPLKGKIGNRKGIKASIETREKLRQSHLGQEAWNKGKGLGRVYYYYPSLFSNAIFRAKIKTRDDYVCQECNISEEEHIIVFSYALSIHHIDYDKKNCNPTNLITVCHACNARANHNKDYWQQHFQDLLKSRDLYR
jgi:hypothetical protein